MRFRSKTTLSGVPLLAILAAAPLGAQEAADDVVIYEREVFHYSRTGRPDPFRSLLQDSSLGIRIEDLALRGVVHHRDPSLSVATLTQKGRAQTIQARIGERIGPLRIISIEPERVEVLVEELGVARREILYIERADTGGGFE